MRLKSKLPALLQAMLYELGWIKKKKPQMLMCLFGGCLQSTLVEGHSVWLCATIITNYELAPQLELCSRDRVCWKIDKEISTCFSAFSTMPYIF